MLGAFWSAYPCKLCGGTVFFLFLFLPSVSSVSWRLINADTAHTFVEDVAWIRETI